MTQRVLGKTISQHRESFFAAMLNKHYAHGALYVKCTTDCVPSKRKLETIEALETNRIPKENASDHDKVLFKWIDSTLRPNERRLANAI